MSLAKRDFVQERVVLLKASLEKVLMELHLLDPITSYGDGRSLGVASS